MSASKYTGKLWFQIFDSLLKVALDWAEWLDTLIINHNRVSDLRELMALRLVVVLPLWNHRIGA